MAKKGGGGRRVVDYHIDMHWGICWGPIDAVHAIRFKEKVAWEGEATTNEVLEIDEQDLFGGDEAEGGVDGQIKILLGHDTQEFPETLAGYFGLTTATSPAFRGIASVFLHNGPNGRGFMVAQNNPYLPAMDVEVSRYSKHPNLNSAHNQIGEDANPVHMIFEIYTNTDWGMGWPVAAFNLASWLDAAEKLFDEGFGLSMMWANPEQIEKFVAEILDHIQAAVYMDPRSGLVEIKLFRDDYDLETARTFSVDNCTLEDMERRALEDTVNEVIVTYTDPESEKDATVTLQDLANIAAQGGLIKSDGRNYYGVRNADLAWKLGERDLREASYPLFSCKILTDRSNADVVPGEVAELVWPEEGITSMAVRILDINLGRKGSGQVILSVVEDIWSLDQGEFESPPTTGWVLEFPDPEPFAQQSAITAPYPVLSRLGVLPDYADVYVGLLAQQGDTATESFKVTTETVDVAGDPEEVTFSGMLQTVFGSLVLAMDAEHTTTIDDADMFNTLGDFTGFATGQVFYIGDTTDDTVNELVLLKSHSVGVWTIKRGLYDTVPRAWAAGTELWYLPSSFSAADPNLRSAGAAVSYWLRPKTAAGTLPKAEAVEMVYTPSERPHLPFRPADVEIEADGGFDTLDLRPLGATMDVTWANRNRTMEDTVALYWTEASVTPEAGQTTTIRFLAPDDTVLDEYTGLTGTSYSVSTTTLAGAGEPVVRVQVLAERDGLESLQYYERTLIIDNLGYGSGYGDSYGG